jgi:hypothetical protein
MVSPAKICTETSLMDFVLDVFSSFETLMKCYELDTQRPAEPLGQLWK